LDFVGITSGLNSRAFVVWLFNNPVLSMHHYIGSEGLSVPSSSRFSPRLC